jgi:hypothetical protein
MWDRMWDRLDVQRLNISNLLGATPSVGCRYEATNRHERGVSLRPKRFQRIRFVLGATSPPMRAFPGRTSSRRVTTPVFFGLVRRWSAKATDSSIALPASAVEAAPFLQPSSAVCGGCLRPTWFGRCRTVVCVISFSFGAPMSGRVGGVLLVLVTLQPARRFPHQVGNRALNASWRTYVRLTLALRP